MTRIGLDAFWMGWSLIGGIPFAYAHKNHHHPDQGPVKQAGDAPYILEKINKTYLATIKPIFKEKCMDCHSSQTRYPWYHSIPGVRQVIDQDIMKAMQHLDFSEDFPFKSHATHQEDLVAIRDSVLDNSMPPFSYRIFHLSSKLTEPEKATVTAWANESIKLLEQKK